MNGPRLLLPLGLTLLLTALGLTGVTRARSGLSRTSTTIHGTPVEVIVSEDESASLRPAVVVLHGLAGSRQLMYGIAQTLARNGYAAAAIDLPGHGQNRERFPARQGRPTAFDTELTYVTAWLRTVPGVDPDRLALVGHSMGAGVAVRFASRDADVSATIAISGGGNTRGPVRPNAPRNLLAMAGAWEFGAVKTGCLAGVAVAYPGAATGHAYGSWVDGTARECVIVPGAEHIGVLFSQDANISIVRWLDRAVGGFPADRNVVTAIPMWSALMLHAASAIGLLLAIGWLFPPNAREPAQSWSRVASFAGGLPAGVVVLASVVPAILAVLVMSLLPGGWLPLLTADYLCGFYFLTGVTMAVGLRQLGVPLIGGRPAFPLVWRSLALAAAVVALFGLIAQHTWLNVWPTGPRWWMACAVCPAWLVYFLVQDRLLRARPASEYLVWSVISTLTTTTVIVAAVFLLRAPSFLLLLVPAFVPLLILHGFYGHLLRSRTTNSLPAAFVNAVVFAWLMAVVFPLV